MSRLRNSLNINKTSEDGSWTVSRSERSRELSMNLVAADVRRLTLFPGKEVRASLRRLLRFRGSMREVLLGRILSMNLVGPTCWLAWTRGSESLSSIRGSGGQCARFSFENF